MASIGLLLSTVFFRQMPNQRWFYAASAALCFSVAWLAMSRTALVGCAVCLLVAHWDLLMTRIGLIACGGLALGACALLIGLSVSGYDDVLLKKSVGVFSKTGDVEEFTTVTGRSEIWAESLKLISRRPLQGYGLGSAKVLLVDHLQSTHNILLHPLLAAGIGAGLITLVLLLWNLLTAFIYPHALIRALAAYVLISGLTEDTIYETFPGVLTLIWLTCCLVPQMPNNCREWFQPPRDLKKTSGNLEGCRS
jgi:O-antigen ligase